MQRILKENSFGEFPTEKRKSGFLSSLGVLPNACNYEKPLMLHNKRYGLAPPFSPAPLRHWVVCLAIWEGCLWTGSYDDTIKQWDADGNCIRTKGSLSPSADCSPGG